MSAANTITLLFNGLTVALALGFLLIILWHDARKELNQLFAAFIFLVTMWNIGSLLAQAFSLVDVGLPLIPLAISLMELGFTGSSIAIYALTAVLMGVHTRRFRWLAFLGMFLVLGYQIFLLLSNTSIPFESLGDGFYKYRFQPLAALFYLSFDGATFYLIWRYRRKIQSRSLIAGITLFVIGQSLGFLNPELKIVSVSINLSSLAALIISFTLLKQEIILPLRERISQVETIHKVSLAITSQLAIDTVLNQIATQAANWLGADGTGIFLNRGEYLELATVFNLPKEYLHKRITLGEGITGSAAQTRRTIHIENYERDWKQTDDLPLAKETFGSVISIPLIYGSEAIGVLLVISGKQGRLFSKNDVELLELLSSQAAVAIAHSHLFSEQKELTKEVEAAHSQLETVLTTTKNPVVAIDRKLQVIFANPAAKALLYTPNDKSTKNTIPQNFLPTNHKEALKSLQNSHTYTYEIETDNKFYLCNTTTLGSPITQGWIAILNDITQLKELDRLKSEMVRMTSHDLKNPLQAAMANLELLTDDLAGTTNLEIPKTIEIIEKQLQRMNRIVSGILDLERAKSGILSLEMCSPTEIIARILEDLKPLADDQGVILTSDSDSTTPDFPADPKQIEHALINLIENAIKFTPKGGQIQIKSSYNEENILFEVTDTGIGIPENLQTQIFDRFFRGAQKGQQGAEHITGSGLGLSLVKTIALNHKGQLWLDSTTNKGSTFYLQFPRVQESSVRDHRKTE
jgi:signal transduction histidine kinase